MFSHHRVSPVVHHVLLCVTCCAHRLVTFTLVSDPIEGDTNAECVEFGTAKFDLRQVVTIPSLYSNIFMQSLFRSLNQARMSVKRN